MENGILLLATGSSYLDEAFLLIESLRKLARYTGPIRVLTDQTNDHRLQLYPEIDWQFVTVPGGKYGSREIKTRMNEFSPFQTTLFLDTDILALRPFDELWATDFCEFGAVIDFQTTIGQRLAIHRDWELPEPALTLSVVEDTTLYFNSGVLLFHRCTNSDMLFAKWHEEWSRFKQYDQLALARACRHVQIQPKRLAWKYNASCIDWAKSADEVYSRRITFAHYWAKNRVKQGPHLAALTENVKS